MIVTVDTETTGFPAYKERSDHPDQPHLVQLALILSEEDGTEVEATSVIIRPDGWVIEPEMTAIHGISHERAMNEGIPECDATIMFVMAQARGRLRVAHNESFDRRIMRIAMVRLKLDRSFIEAVEERPSFCTCVNSTKIVNLPPSEKMVAKGMKGPKSPKLEECVRAFFGEELLGAHDALVDARAAARVYFHLTKAA